MFYVLAALALWLLLPRLLRKIAAWKNQTPFERSFATRFAAFVCLLAFIFLIAALHLPPLGCVILMVPVFLSGMTLARWWQNSRERLRRKAEAEASFERARRIN